MYLKQKPNENQKRHGRQISRSIQDKLANKIRVWEYDDFTDYVICLCYFATQKVDSFSTQNNCVGKMKEFYVRNRCSYMHTLRTHSFNTRNDKPSHWFMLLTGACDNHVNRTLEGEKEKKAYVFASMLKNFES